jgi:hypothetical protein
MRIAAEGTVNGEAIAPMTAPPSMEHNTRRPDETGRMRPPRSVLLVNVTS